MNLHDSVKTQPDFMRHSKENIGMPEYSRHEIQTKHDYLKSHLDNLIKTHETSATQKIVDGIKITKRHKNLMLENINLIANNVEHLNNLLLR